MYARLGAPGDPFATFFLGPQGGDFIDQLVRDCSPSLLAILFAPAFLGPGSDFFVANPSEVGVVDASGEVGRKLGPEQVPGTRPVFGHKHHDAVDDLDAPRVLAG